jgi:transcriptional regulator with XRE-family HTH domain
MTAPDRIIATTDLVTLRLSDLARVLGVTPQVLSQWRTGRRTPHPDNLRVLADWYLRHAQKLAGAAGDLRELADLLEDPVRREEIVVNRPRADSVPAKGGSAVRKTAPPQLRRRRGCRPGT